MMPKGKKSAVSATANNKEPRPAVFLDRDGTIIEEVGYIDTPEKVRLLPGAVEAIGIFRQLQCWVLVLSNQSGVARGFFPESRVAAVNAHLQQLLRLQGVEVDAFYYCPHHPEAHLPAYRIQCECRKPRPGMIQQAMRDFPVIPSRSVIIGDRYSDVEAGKQMHLTAILVRTGYGANEYALYRTDTARIQPDFVAADLLEAARWVENRLRE